MYSGSLNGEKWAAECIMCSEEEYHLKPRTNCLGIAVDRCGVNGVCLRVVSLNWLNCDQFDCSSHTLMHVGEALDVKVLKKFVSAFHTVMQDSMMGRDFWLHLVKESKLVPCVIGGKVGQWKVTYSSTRWLGWVEVALTIATVIMERPLLMTVFLKEKKHAKFAVSSMKKMRKIWENAGDMLKLKCEAKVIQVPHVTY